ncbi:MAG: response regulator [Desulfobacterales bacterium]|nr:response regulator [Desulfobacterales bacterium]
MSLEQSKILVVDDDPFVRDLLGFVLDSEGYAIETAEDGMEGLKKYSSDADINLVISDMNMPEMNGLEMLEKIRSDKKNIPFILLSGDDDIAVGNKIFDEIKTFCLIKDENIQDTIGSLVNKILTNS